MVKKKSKSIVYILVCKLRTYSNLQCYLYGTILYSYIFGFCHCRALAWLLFGLFGRESNSSQQQQKQFIDSICVLLEKIDFFLRYFAEFSSHWQFAVFFSSSQWCRFWLLIVIVYAILFFCCVWVWIERQNWVDLLLLLLLLFVVATAFVCKQTSQNYCWSSWKFVRA